MKVYFNTVVLLGLPGNERRMLEFSQEALSRRQRGISWPTVGYFKVKSIVGAKARGNGSTKIGGGRDCRNAELKILQKILAVHGGARGEGAVTPKTPNKAMQHVRQGRKTLLIENSWGPSASPNITKVFVVE
jgi:hypothetical protein